MISDQLGEFLHGRSSWGEVLSAVEIEQLEAWYAQKDAEEAQLLKRPATDVDCEALQAQIDVSLEKIGAVSQRIREVSAENAVLRQEIVELQQELIVPESA
jgi:peptidoglycan hydrolase CwlO-like protein